MELTCRGHVLSGLDLPRYIALQSIYISADGGINVEYADKSAHWSSYRGPGSSPQAGTRRHKMHDKGNSEKWAKQITELVASAFVVVVTWLHLVALHCFSRC